MRALVAVLAALACGAEPWPNGSCEAVCRGLQCEVTATACFEAAALYGCACEGCADCRPAGRNTTPGCAHPCFGDTRGCDAFVPLGATCIDPETNEYSNYFSSTCDCAGCLLCDETDDFAPAVDACDSGGGGASLEISTEAALRAALAVGAPCTKVALGGDMALGEAATMARAVRLVGAVRIVGADGPARPVLSPASGPHRLVTVMNQAFVSLTSVILRDGFDAFAGGCIFVARGSAITLDRVALENCAAGAAGGGVAMWTAASLRASRSSFDGNAALMVGGSLYGHNRATIVLTDATTVENSSSVVGGGVAVLKAGSLEVAKASRIEACSARVNGGGAYIGRDSVMTVSSGSAVATSHAEFRGGGLFSHFFSTVVLEGRCVFANCTAHAGGGMQISNGAVLQASDSTFVGCVGTTVGGGGIDMGTGGTGGGTFGTFATVDFYRCTAPTGGGGGLALVTASSATLTNSRFFDCTAGAAGGAVATFAAGVSVALKQTVFTACHAAGDGGAFFLAQDCRASIDASTFSDSTAGGDGGAIATSAASKLAVFGGTRVERNVAARGGGGLALRATSNVGVANVVIADNVAVGGGGGAATAGAGATLHLGRVTLLRGNVAAVDGGAVEIFGRGAHLYVSASCSFVQVTLDWNAATLDAPEASVSLDYDGAPAGPGRDARGLRTTFSPQNGAAEIFEGCLPPGRGYELWASSVNGRSWVRGSWALTLPPHGASILSSVDNRLTFVQAVNEYGVLGVSAAAAHGALAAKFHLDEDGASFDAAADGGAAVRIVGNVAIAGDGGGFSVALEGHAVVYEALFEANVALAGSGGAVDVGAQSKADLQGIIAVANVAYRDGGAVAVNTLSEFNIYNSTATANVAGKRGGFASLERVRAVSLRSVVARGNRAAERGGALALVICDQAPPVVVVANSTFDRNSAALGSGAIDIGARSVVSACGARSSPILRVEGATLFTGNSVDAGNGGGIAVRPTGASLALASQPETCIAVLRVVVDWRRNAARCEIIGAIPGSVDGAVEKSCDMVPSNCDALRTFAGVARCNGCTCKTSQPGAGESFFRVDHVANSNSARTEAAPLFVGEPDAGAAKEFEYCLGAGSYEIVAYDRRGAAWFGGTLEATLWNFDGFEPTYRATAAWSPSGLETDPVGFVVGAADPVDLAVRFVDNKALKGGGAAVYYDVEAPAGLEAAETYSMDNAAAYSSFAATPAVQLLINTTFATAYAVPNAAMPAISAVLVDSYGQVVRSDSTTVVNARFIDNNQGTVKAWGLVAVCVRGVATFDMITITGLPGDTHQLRFLSPIAALETAPLPVELTPCPVGFVERADGAAAVSCIPCKYTEYYIRGRCVPCPRGAACDRYEPLDASSARVGYQLFTVETLPIKRGFYRFFATSEEIYECADEVYCSANECSCAGVGYEAAFHDPTLTHGAQLCAAHSEGPLCALCGTGRYPRPSSLGQGGGCAKCDGNSVLPIFFAVVIAAFLAMLAVVCAAAIACSGIARTRRRVLRAASFVRSRWFVVAAVQVWYAISTVSRFVAIENVDYPEPLQTVLQYLGFISLDLSFVISSMKCYYYMSYFELFLAWTLFPLAFGVLLAIGVAAVAAARVRGPPWPNEVLRYVTRTDAGRSTRRTATSLFWLVLVLLHNYICSLMFTFYSCSERFAVSEKRREQWLAYDYEVRCGSDAYHTFEGAAATLLVLYVITPASRENSDRQSNDGVLTES